MDSSEKDAPQEQPISPFEPQAGHEVSPTDPKETDDAEEPESGPAVEEEPPLEPAEPGLYWCEEAYSGSHPVLQGTIHQGENDLTAMTNPEELMAVAALVREGVLTPMDGPAKS